MGVSVIIATTVIVRQTLMTQNVTMIDRLLANIRKEREANREAFKKDIQALINEGKIDYVEALGAM